jgi:hypothetical protein
MTLGPHGLFTLEGGLNTTCTSVGSELKKCEFVIFDLVCYDYFCHQFDKKGYKFLFRGVRFLILNFFS